MTYQQPVLPLLLLLALAVGVIPRRTSRGLHRLSVLAGLALFLWTWPPVAWLFSGSLEWWYHHGSFSREPGAIVVLGGTMEAREVGIDHRLARDTFVRCAYAAWLHRKWRRVPILVTGSVGIPGDATITNRMRTQLVADGVPEEMIWAEPRSTSTSENAVNSAKLLHEKGIRSVALVTEGIHMLRAEASFRKQGFEVQPAPCAFRATSTFGSNIGHWAPGARAIRDNEEALHEWVGMAYYWARGYI